MPQLCFNCFHQHDSSAGLCPHCGFDLEQQKKDYPVALTAGTMLNSRYYVGRVLGQGGFGITYVALDTNLNAKVAIKEFMPSELATRLDGKTVSVYAGDKSQEFDYGEERFLEEARTLAQFIGNPNIAGVSNYFTENETSYFVMDYIEGVSFKAYIAQQGGTVPLQDALNVMIPVLNALSAVHQAGFIHRDVTPDNIFITKDGGVKLLDFGSARYSVGDRSKSLDVILKVGYAPKEQYIRRGRQGPYTDVYSCAACLYACLTGYLPPESLERMEEDTLTPVSQVLPEIPEYINNSILKGLAVNAEDRFQSAQEFLQAIEGQTVVALPTSKTVVAEPVKKKLPIIPIVSIISASVVACIAILAVTLSGTNDTVSPTMNSGGADSTDVAAYTESATTNTSNDVSDKVDTDALSLVSADVEPDGVVAGTAVTIASSTDVTNMLLPSRYTNAQFFYTLVYDTLFWSPSGDWTDLEGLLVTDYTVSGDGLTWVMNLQEGVHFHNGNSLNADSVIGSFDYYIANNYGAGLDCVASYKATGEYQVTLQLNGTNPELLYNLALSNLAIFDYTATSAMGAGSGPYYIDSYNLGSDVVLVAIEDYWMDVRQGHIETVTIEITTDSTAIYTGLYSGEFDYGNVDDFDSVVQLPNCDTVTYEGGANVIWINSGGDGDCKYLSNTNVRKALDYMIDESEFVMGATFGYGSVGGNLLNEAFNDYYYNKGTYDPFYGLELLENEGVSPSNISLTALVPSGMETFFSYIQAQLMMYGIILSYVTYDSDVAMMEGLTENWDLLLVDNSTSGLPYYTTALSNILGPDATYEVITDETLHVEIMDFIAQATSASTLEESYLYLAQACQTLDENSAYLATWTTQSWCCFNKRIANTVIDLNTGFWRVFDSWVVE